MSNTKKTWFTKTVTGLAYHLGFDSRQSIADYAKDDRFSYTIKRAKLQIERYLEHTLFGNNVTGTIFNLKNNFGWTDKLDINADVSQDIKITEAELDKEIAELQKQLENEDH